MTDQKTPDPWDYLAEFIEGNAVRPPGGQQVGPPRYPLVPSVAKELRGIVEAGKRALAAERAQHQQALIDQRVIGHAEGQAHAIADVNAGRIDDLIALRLAQHQQEIAQRDETIRQPQDAFARCREVQQATAETWRIEHDQMAEQIRLLRGAMAADDERLRRAAEQAGILYVSCDTAEALAEQIARLSAEVEEQRSFKILMIKDATRLEAARDEAVSEAATLRAERDAAQQQIATLTQERDAAQEWSDMVTRGQSPCGHWKAYSYQEDLTGARLTCWQCRADAAEARCATLTAALEPFAALAECYDPPEGDDHEIAWDRKPTLGQLRSARAALQSTRPQEQP